MTNPPVAAQPVAGTSVWGKHRGRVAGNDDPRGIGRLKVTVPGILGDEQAWALPCAPFGGSDGSGLLVLPEVGANVWIEFEGGDLAHPIWVGTYWSQGFDTSNDFGGWQRRTLRTVGGQMVQLDDEPGSTRVLLAHGSGAQVEIDDDGRVTVRDHGGNELVLDPDASSTRLADVHGNRIQTDSSGVVVENAQGTKVELNAVTATVKATTVNVDATLVKLGGGGEPVLKGTSFLAGYMAHTHPTGAGPSGPPIPTTEQSALSQKVMTA